MGLRGYFEPVIDSTAFTCESQSTPAHADAGLIDVTLLLFVVRVPERLREADQQEAIIREYEHDHTAAIAVDFGLEAGGISVDTVGEAVIVVTGGEQFEFKLPTDADSVTTNNGVLTIEG